MIAIRLSASSSEAKLSTSALSSPVSSRAIALCREYTFPILFISGKAAVSSEISMSSLSTVSKRSEDTQSSPTLPVVPSARVNDAAFPIVASVPVSALTFSQPRSIEVMPSSARVFSSPSPLVPLPSASTQMRRLPKISSFSSITPSPLPSYRARASKPFFAAVPSASRVRSPKSSPPSSTMPLPFKSRHKKPSLLVQLIFSAKPFLSRSKLAPFSLVSMLKPSPSRSKIRGS